MNNIDNISSETSFVIKNFKRRIGRNVGSFEHFEVVQIAKTKKI